MPPPDGTRDRCGAPRRPFLRRRPLAAAAISALALAACERSGSPTGPPLSFRSNPCLPGDTVQLAAAQATRVDCSNGGTTVTLAGDGASYLVVAQFATDQGPNQLVRYSVASGRLAAATQPPSSTGGASGLAGGALRATGNEAAQPRSALPPVRPNPAQLAADRLLRARARGLARAGFFRQAVRRAQGAAVSAEVAPPPPVGSVRSFRVLSSLTPTTWKSVDAQLAYVGDNILLYLDTLAPAGGFTATQLQNFGQYFDQTLYPIDTTAFGRASDVDQNGHVIMLMSPVVNGLTPSGTCLTSGYVAGFFNEEDLSGASDPNSNQGEIFYSIAPDPNGVYSCAHTVGELGYVVPTTFLHELQHVIGFSQRVIVGGLAPLASWLDEGLSIVAEELGSLYFEQKCPPPSCRTNPAQIFPDSSQGFVQTLLYDSYQYALIPDTASLTLHDDSELGFSWRGGDWLLLRWLGDQMGSAVYRSIERGPAGGLANIAQAAGQPFGSLFANFGLALYTDSLPGLPRTTAPAVNRFVTRNVKQLWARLYATAGPANDIPTAQPLRPVSIAADTTAAVMAPGTMVFFRLDTAAGESAVTVQFAAPGGTGFAAALKPQLAVFRLPPGQ